MKCTICSFTSDNLEQIIAHIFQDHCNVAETLLLTEQKSDNLQLSNNILVFICSICSRLSTNKNDLKTHMIQDHEFVEDESVKQETRTKQTSTGILDVAKNIIQQEQFLRKVKCSLVWCKATFPTDEQCEKHKQLHIYHNNDEASGNVSNFKCSKCERTFRTWITVRDHLYREHQIDFGLIKCPMCNGFKSYCAVSVLKHLETHSSNRQYLCSICGKTFKQMRQLRNHEVLHRPPDKIPPRSRSIICEKCNQHFASARCLKRHMQTIHENVKKFQCHLCDHRTTRKTLLEAHMRLHTGAKPFACDRCEYKAIDSNSLRRHILKHDGVPEYICPYCPYTCIQSGSLKYHLIKQHNGEGTFPCEKCNFTTISLAVLQSHQKQHDN